ncbi:hypothetical protein ROM10_19200 [Cronobacter sakazakii]|uniref:hypothetical protein n=2 Tax=Cronobacter sakazakii TaxID=28141 RepID=UPI002893CA93|nr:hypothetical protein [Cronobacter sakazakii]MDT3612168.1 hypothetical protein [Cronobacter sakazakii]
MSEENKVRAAITIGGLEDIPERVGLAALDLEQSSISGNNLKGSFDCGLFIGRGRNLNISNNVITMTTPQNELLELIDKLNNINNREGQLMASMLIDFNKEKQKDTKLSKYKEILEFIKLNMEVLPPIALGAVDILKALLQ